MIESTAFIFDRLFVNVKLSVEEKKRLSSIFCYMSAAGTGPGFRKKLPDGLPTVEALFMLFRRVFEAGKRP